MKKCAGGKGGGGAQAGTGHGDWGVWGEFRAMEDHRRSSGVSLTLVHINFLVVHTHARVAGDSVSVCGHVCPGVVLAPG